MTTDEPECKHIKANPSQLRKSVEHGFALSCQVCLSTKPAKGKKNGTKKDKTLNKKIIKAKHEQVLWACLQCGGIACGKDDEKHALEHFERKQHPLAVSPLTFDIW